MSQPHRKPEGIHDGISPENAIFLPVIDLARHLQNSIPDTVEQVTECHLDQPVRGAPVCDMTLFGSMTMKVSNRLDRLIGPLTDWQVDVDKLFDHLLGEHRPGTHHFVPRTNIVESSTGFRLSMELPGVAMDDVTVEVIEGRLVISGEKKIPEAEGESLVRGERLHGTFRRAFDFPDQVDFEKIGAQFCDGLLVISVPKSEKVLPRRIEIKSNK
jgi:HSP20 family protein